MSNVVEMQEHADALDALVEAARERGVITLDAITIKLGLTPTEPVVVAARAACAAAGEILDEGEEVLGPDELARARRRKAAARAAQSTPRPGGSADSMRLYLREIGRVPLLTAVMGEEFRDIAGLKALAQAIRQGDSQAAHDHAAAHVALGGQAIERLLQQLGSRQKGQA